MFTPQELEKMPIELEKLFRRLEMDIMMDIIRRMKINNNEITRSTDWQIYRLNQLGQSKRAIKKYLEKSLELSEKEINAIYKKAIKSGYTEDEELYKASGKSFVDFEDNEELQQLIIAVKEQTNNELYNITQSTGFIKTVDGKNVFTPLTQYYQETLDNAVNGVLNGAFDYNTIIKKTVNEMTRSGLRSIDYASGRSYRIDSAVRTAVMTGVNQVASKISDNNAKELDTEYFEVSAHGTARPSHQEWQGKVYTRKELEEICGLGEVDGLCGANCRHSYYPFIPGISERTYTDKELKEWAKEENTPREFNGKQYTAYEASQEQRRLERLMRKQRQDIKLLKEADANEEDIITAQAKHRITSDEYVKFSKSMGLPEQRARIYQDGLTGNLAGGKGVTKRIKDDKIIKELRGKNIKGKIHLEPTQIDIDTLLFDENHVNKEREHKISEEEAKSFIKKAKISITKWGGKFENYYSEMGSVYVNLEKHLIRTAFDSSEYKGDINDILEVLQNNGR